MIYLFIVEYIYSINKEVQIRESILKIHFFSQSDSFPAVTSPGSQLCSVLSQSPE